MSNSKLYLEEEFRTLIAAQWGKETPPSPTALMILRRVFFAGAQSIYIGLHQSSGIPETEFMDKVGDEIGMFVLNVKVNNAT